MNSSDHPSAYGYQPPNKYGYHSSPPPFLRPHIQEDTLKEGYIQAERKIFQFKLKENDRGRFLRITEDKNGRRNAIIIPGTGLKDFQKLLGEMLQASESLPAQAPAPDPQAP